MNTWLVTGVSGCGRIEFLEEIVKHANKKGKKVLVHDIGRIINEECKKLSLPISDNKMLDVDNIVLRLLRSLAFKEVELSILKDTDVDLHFIGIHAVFPWKGRLIPGISFSDLVQIELQGILNIVDNVETVYRLNGNNPKWNEDTVPNPTQTQEWMMEEELVSQILSEAIQKNMYVLAKDHRVKNIYDMFFNDKKKIYLSYPITAVREENNKLLDRIQTEYLDALEKLFIVFNPLTIKDMALISKQKNTDLPDEISKLDARAIQLIKSRTIERDFRFIDQSDAVVVLYLTEKLSPGVLAEIYYAHRNQKPVYILFPFKKSPFLESAVTESADDFETLIESLKVFASQI